MAPKNIVVCYDGTGNEYGIRNSNVVKLFRHIMCDDETQMAFYDPGVGTFNPFKPGGYMLGLKKLGILLGNGFGWGIETNLQEGYRYLMNHYHEGDRLFLFGFSRGAYTARALAGMLYYFGLLEKGSDNLIPYVSKYYVNRNFERARGFRDTFCRPCRPWFIGVWDTVGSVDYFGRHKFFDAQLKENVTNGFQAISIDEKRSKFPISMWDESRKAGHQHIEQVWFPGVHSDVGGGYAETGLSDIALGWMMEKAQSCKLILKEGWQHHLNQNAGGVMHQSYKKLWRLLGKRKREIPEEALIHQSVFDRMKAIPGYKPELPENLQKASNRVYGN